MKKLGYFLARNTTNILALYFIGWAVWAGCNWESVTLVQKLLMGLFLLLVGSFLILEVTTWKTTGKPIPQILANARTFAKKRFGKQ